jgi:hypothetical protein
MDRLDSMLVVIISDDEKTAFRLRRTATAHGANVCATRGCTPADLEAMGRVLAAVVVDLRSSEEAWELVEPLRRSAATNSVPVLLRYDARHAMTAELLQSLNEVRVVESEQGADAACDALGGLLDTISLGLPAAVAAAGSGAHAWPARLGGRYSSSPEVV